MMDRSNSAVARSQKAPVIQKMICRMSEGIFGSLCDLRRLLFSDFLDFGGGLKFGDQLAGFLLAALLLEKSTHLGANVIEWFGGRGFMAGDFHDVITDAGGE